MSNYPRFDPILKKYNSHGDLWNDQIVIDLVGLKTHDPGHTGAYHTAGCCPYLTLWVWEGLSLPMDALEARRAAR